MGAAGMRVLRVDDARHLFAPAADQRRLAHLRSITLHVDKPRR